MMIGLRRIILFLCLMLGGWGVGFAQERLTSVSEVLAALPSDGCVCADYDLTVSAPKNAVINYSGKIWWQDGSFRIEGDGYGIWCDGVHLWTVDSVAREIVREAAVPIDELIPNSPEKSGGNEIELKTTLDGGKIREISLKTKNGTSVSIAVSSMDTEAPKSPDFFTYAENSAPAGFVITILD